MTSETAAPPKPQQNALIAVSWMMGALISFTLIAIAGREAAKGVDTFQLMFWRSFVGMIVLIAIVLAKGARFGRLGTPRTGLHVLRNTIHWVAQFSWLYALTRMPLAELFALEFTSPLWVALLAPLFLGEHLTRARLMAAVLGFVGVLLVVRPGAVPLGDGTIFGLTCAVGFALSMMCTKRLLVTDSAFTILFWMQTMQTAIGFVFLIQAKYTGVGFGTDGSFAIPDAPTSFWVFLVGVLGLTAHYSLAQAFRHADAIIVAPMDFLRLPLIAVVGVLLYKEALDPWVLAGGAVVVLANLINIRSERARRPA